MKRKILIPLILLICVIFLIYKRNTIDNVNLNFISGIYNKQFESHVVFYPQHQDDEVLWGGSAIVNAIHQCGVDNVYIVLVSDGSGVNFFNNKKYKNLTRNEKKEFRDNEFKSSLNELGIKKNNIIILSNIDTHQGTHYSLMKETILDFEKSLGNVTHIAHHYKYDNHIMHRKNGSVLKELSDNKEVQNVMYFIKPDYLNKISINDRALYTCTNKSDYEKVKSACLEYKNINTKDKKLGIGYISAHRYFDYLLNDKTLMSILSLK